MIRLDTVVGNDDAKLALALVAVDPAIGGVLLVGPPGVAKSTMARGLAVLLGDAPFVEVPLGATEDRIKGSIDLAGALRGGEVRLRQGLLGAAHGGVLYLDEVNLQPDHVVDLLLDAAASGVNRVERDGVSASEPAQFALVATMNPEEGALRPQLRDRFAMVVEVAPLAGRDERRRALERALTAGEHPDETDRLAIQLARARLAEIALDESFDWVVDTVLAAGVASLRADIALARAARARAALEGRRRIEQGDVARVAPLILAGRQSAGTRGSAAGASSTTLPNVAPTGSRGASAAPDDTRPGSRAGSATARDDGARAESVAGQAESASSARQGQPPRAESAPWEDPRFAGVTSALPRPRSHRRGLGAESHELPHGERGSVSLTRSVLARIERAGAGPIAPEDVRRVDRARRDARCVILVVDASGSQSSARSVAIAAAVIEELLGHAYQARAHVAVVTVSGDGAQVVLRPTRSLEVARARMDAIDRRGPTPLAAGLREASRLAEQLRHRGLEPLLVLITDGRPTVGEEGLGPVEATLRAAAALRRLGIEGIVAEVPAAGGDELGVCQRLADASGLTHVVAEEA